MGYGITVNRDFAYAPDQALALRGAEYIRPMTYGGGWSRIRMGMLICAERNAASTASTVGNRLFFGLCNSKMPVSAYSTVNFTGLSMFGDPVTGGNGAYGSYSVSGNDYHNASTAGQCFRKYQNQIQNGTAFTNGTLFYLPLTAVTSPLSFPRRTMVVLDIARSRGGSGACTLSAYFVASSAGVNMDFRPDHLWQAIDNWGTPTINGITMTVGCNAVATNIGEEFGVLDAVSIYWSNTRFNLEVYAVGANVLLDSEPPVVGSAYESFEGFNAGTYVPGVTQDSYGTKFNIYPNTGTLNIPAGWTGTWALTQSGSNYSNAAPVLSSTLYSAQQGIDPLETFDFYGTGTVISGVTVNAGTLWADYGTLSGTSLSNPSAQFGFASTSCGYPWESFDSYPLGPVVNTGSWTSGGTYAPGFFSGGTGWADSGTSFTRNTNFSSYDTFESYGTGTSLDGLNGGVSVGGLYWSGTYTGKEGFTKTLATDTFESYGTGTPLDGLSGGIGWAGTYVARV